jgi:hypothetical protein
MCGYARRKGVEVLALAPLARGDAALMSHPTVQQLAAALNKTPAQVRSAARRVLAGGQTNRRHCVQMRTFCA